MPEHTDLPKSSAALDEFVRRLLDCGGVLSQIVSHMVQTQASGRSAPDAAPIPTVAHELIVSVLTELKRGHSRRDLMVAAAIVGEATEAICENIFCVDLDAEEESGGDEHPGATSQ